MRCSNFTSFLRHKNLERPHLKIRRYCFSKLFWISQKTMFNCFYFIIEHSRPRLSFFIGDEKRVQFVDHFITYYFCLFNWSPADVDLIIFIKRPIEMHSVFDRLSVIFISDDLNFFFEFNVYGRRLRCVLFCVILMETGYFVCMRKKLTFFGSIINFNRCYASERLRVSIKLCFFWNGFSNFSFVVHRKKMKISQFVIFSSSQIYTSDKL